MMIDKLSNNSVRSLIVQQGASDVHYVRYCKFNGMQLASGILMKRKNKYRDTIVSVKCSSDGDKQYFIDLIYYTDRECK